ncbi:MAG: NYN domain-containing protein [Lentisphaeria bacterium]|nr:NYN domain-containing protein [Candidatus Neomarinimicrobiota bacterium]MCF7842020.1 NYN domain-containing protein [Lentisphaeria bacterium]
MKTFLIDGYNLLRRVPQYAEWEQQLTREHARDKVEDDLSGLTAVKDIRLILVWDGPPPGSKSSQRQKGILTIQYSGGRSADEILKQLLQKKGGELVLVSDDADIIKTAQLEGREFQTCQNFYKYVHGLVHGEQKSKAGKYREEPLSDDEVDYWREIFEKKDKSG